MQTRGVAYLLGRNEGSENNCFINSAITALYNTQWRYLFHQFPLRFKTRISPKKKKNTQESNPDCVVCAISEGFTSSGVNSLSSVTIPRFDPIPLRLFLHSVAPSSFPAMGKRRWADAGECLSFVLTHLNLIFAITEGVSEAGVASVIAANSVAREIAEAGVTEVSASSLLETYRSLKRRLLVPDSGGPMIASKSGLASKCPHEIALNPLTFQSSASRPF